LAFGIADTCRAIHQKKLKYEKKTGVAGIKQGRSDKNRAFFEGLRQRGTRGNGKYSTGYKKKGMPKDVIR